MKEHIKHIKEKIDKFGILKILIILIVAAIIFQAGIFVGYHKAGFYRSMGNNYYRPYDDKGRGFGNKGGIMGGITGEGNFMMQNANIPGGHGAVGKIVSINLPTIVIASPDNVEKTISISDDTLIRQFRDTIGAKDLMVGEYVVVIGDNSNADNASTNTGADTGANANNQNTGVDGGVVKAKLIRLLPAPQGDQNAQGQSAPTSSNAPQAPAGVTSSNTQSPAVAPASAK